MKKIIIALAVIGFALQAEAQVINFMNACNFKVALQTLTVIKMDPLRDESGDWSGNGVISYTLPVIPTSNVPGITYKHVTVVFNAPCSIYVSNSVIQAKAGSNDVVKLNKVLKDMGRAVGADWRAQLAQ